MPDIDTLAEKLSFVGSTAAAYKIALALQGAENPEAAAISMARVWKRKEAALKRELEADRSHSTTSTAGTRPQRVPTTRAEFDRLGYLERLWVFHNAPETYRRYTGTLTKKDIMAIRDPQERQKAIGENLHLFL